MSRVIVASVGLAVAGLPGALLALALHGTLRLRRRLRGGTRGLRPLLIVLLVELRSGRSVLGALQTAAGVFPRDRDLVLAARVATISGLTRSVAGVTGEMRGVMAQLARAQRSGAGLGDTVRSMIESDIAAEKAKRVARSRSLPVRLMIPMTLLVLPGLILLLYAPSMLRLFEQLSGPLQ